MTVFLTPAGEPYYGGPTIRRSRATGCRASGRSSGIAEAWRDRREDVARSAGQLVEAVRQSASLRPSLEPLTEELLLEGAARAAAAAFEPAFGGWGRAPKFPNAPVLEFLLRRGDDTSLAMVVKTLDGMAAGGMHDLLGGGFHRYSVDDRWLVPRFEKMLYDNALLAPTYLHAWLATGEDRYRAIAESTIEYLLPSCCSPKAASHPRRTRTRRASKG